MSLINPPGIDTVDRHDKEGKSVEVNPGWRNFFVAVYTICNGLTQSGTTAERPVVGPTTILWRGRTFWDTTLGIPIYYNGTVWVNSAGAPV